MNRSRWLVLAALGLLLIVLSNSHVPLFHGGFRLFGFNPLVTAILLAVVIWFVLDRCGTSTMAPAGEPAESTEPASEADDASADDSAAHENGEDPDTTD